MLCTGATLPWQIIEKCETFIKIFIFMECKTSNEGLQEVCINFGLMTVNISLALLVWSLVSN